MNEEQILAIIERLWFDGNEFGISDIKVMYPEVEIAEKAKEAIQRFIRAIPKGKRKE